MDRKVQRCESSFGGVDADELELDFTKGLIAFAEEF